MENLSLKLHIYPKSSGIICDLLKHKESLPVLELAGFLYTIEKSNQGTVLY